jgi:hypothetical protein
MDLSPSDEVLQELATHHYGNATTPLIASPLLPRSAKPSPQSDGMSGSHVQEASRVLLPSTDKKTELWMNVMEQQQQIAQNQQLRRELEERASSFQKSKKRVTTTITWLTSTSSGVALVTVAVVVVLLLILRPPFVQDRPANELEEPTLSMSKIIAVGLSCGGIVFAAPLMRRIVRWIQTTHNDG